MVTGHQADSYDHEILHCFNCFPPQYVKFCSHMKNFAFLQSFSPKTETPGRPWNTHVPICQCIEDLDTDFLLFDCLS